MPQDPKVVIPASDEVLIYQDGHKIIIETKDFHDESHCIFIHPRDVEDVIKAIHACKAELLE